MHESNSVDEINQDIQSALDIAIFIIEERESNKGRVRMVESGRYPVAAILRKIREHIKLLPGSSQTATVSDSPNSIATVNQRGSNG